MKEITFSLRMLHRGRFLITPRPAGRHFEIVATPSGEVLYEGPLHSRILRLQVPVGQTAVLVQ
jgi:hypothetical protein